MKLLKIKIRYILLFFGIVFISSILILIYYFFIRQENIGKTSFVENDNSVSGNLVNKLVDEQGNEILLKIDENGNPVEDTGSVSTGNQNVATGNTEDYDQETLSWIDKIKNKAKTIASNQQESQKPLKQDGSKKLDPKESIEFIKGLQKQPFNIKGYYFGITYGLGMEDQWGMHTIDSIKLFVYNESTKKLVIFGLPRDWQIQYNGKTMKLDFLYQEIISKEKDEKKALELTTNYISNLLDIPINYYVMIDFSDFKKFIDEIGGVDLCVDKNLLWEKKLLLEKGCYTLDGDLTLKLSRIRKQDNDFFRMMRQNNVVYSIIEKIKTLGLVRTFTLADEYLKIVHTNLNIGEIIYIFNNFKDFTEKKQVILNSECNFYRGRFNMNFCFFYGAKQYFLKQFVETPVLNHYLKTMILYPEINGCEISGQGTYLQKLNLMNLGMSLNNRTFKVRKDFQINSLSGCSEKAVNYFLNIGGK